MQNLLWGDSSSCLSCYPGRLFMASQCLICNSLCNTYDIIIKNCTSCASGLFLSKALTLWTCCITCPDGYYGETSTFICNLCDVSCLTCNGATMSQCLTCPNGRYLSGSQCLFCDSNCVNCSGSATQCTSCETNEFLSNALTCDLCNSTCKTCDLNANKCTGCYSGTFLIIWSQTIWIYEAPCPSGYYGDTLLNICLKCAFPCESCNVTSDHCITCKPGYYFSSGICNECDGKCSTCITLSTTCLSCPTRSGTSLLANDCLSECPNGYYKRTLDYTCQFCDSSCASCQDQGSFACTGCLVGYYLLPNSLGNIQGLV